MSRRFVNIVGPVVMVVAFVLGLAGAGGLYAWESAERGQAQATPAPSSVATSVAASMPASPTAAPAATAPASSTPTATPAGSATAAAAGDPAAGKDVFNTVGCNNCHPGGKRAVGPDISGPAFNARYPTDDAIARIVRQGRGVMPAFGPAQLSDRQLTDVIAYLRSLK